MGYKNNLIVVVLSLFFTGCASMVGSKEQDISIETMLNGDKITDARCSLNNSEGTWIVNTPGSATVHKSRSDLNIKCEKEPHAPGLAVVESSINSSMLGNILMPGGIIGAVVDAGTGAGFDYPYLITVALGEPYTLGAMKDANVVANNVEFSDGPNDCIVKGIVRFGEKFYYVPGDRKYSDLAINPGRGDKWFCTEEEARHTGFRAIIK